MSIVLIQNKNLYKLYKDLPYNFNSAIFHLLDCFIKKSNKQKTNIRFYVNLKEKWIQLISENNLYDMNKKELIWEHDLGVATFDWKYPIFYLAKTVSIEMKDYQSGIKSQISLNSDGNEIEILNVKRESILSKYEIATRLTIMNFNYEITQDIIENLIDKISYVYREKIAADLLDIKLMIIDDSKIYQFIKNDMIEVVNNDDLLSIKANTNSLYKVIKTELLYQNKNYIIECELSNSNSPTLYLSNKTRIINDLSIINNPLFNNSFKFDINIKILNLKLNLFRTDFNWQLLPFNIMMDHISNVISSDLNKTKTSAANDVDDQFSFIELENLKNLLTSSFDGFNNTNRFDNFEIKKDKLKFSYHADDNKKITINLIKTKQKDFENEWLQLEPVLEEHIEQNYEYNVTFNIAHPFFNYFSKDKEDINKIEQLIICYAIAETICRLDGNDVTQLKYEINKLLRGT